MIGVLRNLVEGGRGVSSNLMIRGPLGIWTFPILNTVILIVNALVNVQVSERRSPKARTYNIVRDERGRIVSIEEVWIE